MKVQIVLAQNIYTAAVPAKIKLDSDYFAIPALMPLFVNTVVEEGSSAGLTIWAELPKVIQAVLESDGSTAGSLVEIDSNSLELYSNFQTATVKKFTRGNNYLVPFSAGSIIPGFIPSGCVWPMMQVGARQAARIANQITASHYLFMATEDVTLLSGAAPTCITFSANVAGLKALSEAKINKAATRQMQVLATQAKVTQEVNLIKR